jgi:hypothetical protein
VLQGRHPISITVLDRLPHASFAHMSVEELTEHVRGLIFEQLSEKQLEPSAEPAPA